MLLCYVISALSCVFVEQIIDEDEVERFGRSCAGIHDIILLDINSLPILSMRSHVILFHYRI